LKGEYKIPLPVLSDLRKKIKPMLRIPEPPDEYKEWTNAVWKTSDSEAISKIAKGYRKKRPDFMDIVHDYLKKVESVADHNLAIAELSIALDQVEFKGEGMTPIQKVELRGLDHKKHGDVEWGLITKVRYRKKKNSEEMIPFYDYILLHPERFKAILDKLPEIKSAPLLPHMPGEKVLMPGGGERGYPNEWDEIEKENDDDKF
jgi:hypothetical protein